MVEAYAAAELVDQAERITAGIDASAGPELPEQAAGIVLELDWFQWSTRSRSWGKSPPRPRCWGPS